MSAQEDKTILLFLIIYRKFQISLLYFNVAYVSKTLLIKEKVTLFFCVTLIFLVN